MEFYIADLHFGHKNCLAFDNRPFRDLDEQDEEIIRRWNAVVTDEDEVWILGDFSWYPVKKTIEVFQQLNGVKRLIIGNHDHHLLRNKDIQALFAEITDYKEYRIKDMGGIVLSHYPIPCFNRHYYGWYHLYGHVHKSFEWSMMERVKLEMETLYHKPCNMFNVGCMIDYMDYTPRTLSEIITANSKAVEP